MDKDFPKVKGKPVLLVLLEVLAEGENSINTLVCDLNVLSASLIENLRNNNL